MNRIVEIPPNGSDSQHARLQSFFFKLLDCSEKFPSTQQALFFCCKDSECYCDINKNHNQNDTLQIKKCVLFYISHASKTSVPLVFRDFFFRARMAVRMIPQRLLANNSYLEGLADPQASILKHGNYLLYYIMLN